MVERNQGDTKPQSGMHQQNPFAQQQRHSVGPNPTADQQQSYGHIVQQRKQTKSKATDTHNGNGNASAINLSKVNVQGDINKGKTPQPKLDLKQYPQSKLELMQEPLTQVQRWSELQRTSNKAANHGSKVKSSSEQVPKYEHPAETLKGVVFAKKGHSINASYESKGRGSIDMIKEVKMRSPTDLDNRINVLDSNLEASNFNTPKTSRQSPVRLHGLKHQKVVQASALFNARQDNSAPRVAVLPNLNQRPQLANMRAIVNGASSGATNSASGGAKNQLSTYKPSLVVEDANNVIAEFSLVRGLQQFATDCDGNKMQIVEQKSQQASFASMQLKFQARKGSHQQPNSMLKAIGNDTKKKLGHQRSNEQLYSYGQLPQISHHQVPATFVHAAQKAHGVPILTASQSHLIRTKDERLIVGNHSMGGGMGGGMSGFSHPFQQVDASQNVKGWYITPSFDLQGKALLDQQLLKKYSLETLQLIRAQAVIAQNNNGMSSIGNQFQPLSPLSRNLPIAAASSACKAKSPGQLNRSQRGSMSPEQIQLDNYNSMLTAQQQQLQQRKPPVGKTRKQTVSELAMGQNQNSRWNSSGRDDTASIAITLQKEQIKTSATSDLDNKQQQEQMEMDNDGNGMAGQTFLGSKSQLNTPLASAGDGTHPNSETNLDEKAVGKRKEGQITNNSKQKTNMKQGGKKTSGDRQSRQFSQAQRQNRNSLVGNKVGGRHVNTSKAEQGSNSRAIAMNSPMMQPPPQILQSKIIIHLLKTEYPLIEQVARQEMAWRVTKTENPNAEFDVYWNDIGIDSEKLQSLKPYQKTNHFPAMFQITRKAFLAKNLKRLQKLYPLEFDFFPRTWVLPNEMNDLRSFAQQKPKKVKPTSPIKKPLSTTNTNANAIATEPATATTTANSKLVLEKTEIAKQPATTINSPTNAATRESRNAPLSSHDEIARNGFKLSQTLPSTAIAKISNVPVIATTEEESEESGGEEEEEDEESEGVSEAPTPTPIVTPKEISPAKRNTTVQREQRKAPLPIIKPIKMKTRFPMIIKPDCSSQGKGIFLTNDIDSIPKDDVYVVQQYMQNPYLLDGLKFDLRLYVLVLSCEPLKIFLYEEGLVRFATHKFKPLDSTSDKNEFNNFFMHLTNYAINKESDQFRAAKSINDDTGHKRTLKKVLDRLKAEGEDTDKIMGEVKDVIVKTMITIQQELAHNYRTCQPADLESLMCFEILGFDIILDDKCKPILLEVNQAPSFATDSPLDYDIKHGLFKDTFRLLGLTVDKKKAKLRRLYEEKKDRMLTKLTLKQKNQMRRQAIAQFQKEQESFEVVNNGRFERIYPLPVREAAESNTKLQNDDLLSVSQKQLALTSYQALQRQQECYHQLIATLSSTDIEKAIRAKNRLDKEEREGGPNGRLRLKKTAQKQLAGVVLNTRNTNHVKKASSSLNDAATTVQPQSNIILKPEESLEQAMRNSVMKPPGNLEKQSVRQSVSDRFDNQHIQSRGGTATSNDAGQATYTLKHTSQQFQHLQYRANNTRKSINLDQNILNFSELQQKLGLSSPSIAQPNTAGQYTKYSTGTAESANKAPSSQQKKTTFNLVNFGHIQQQNGGTILQSHHTGNNQSLTGRAVSTKKTVILTQDGKQPQGIEGLKPTIQQLQYNTPGTFSQSHNPVSLGQKKITTPNIEQQYDTKMNRTQGQSNRQGNLLPNIARNMIPVEKSSPNFTNGSQQNVNQQQNEFSTRAHPHHRQGFRGSEAHSAALNVPNSGSTSNMSSPKRGTAVQIDRAQMQRASMQSISKQQPLAMKTQQMNLGVMNIQPVIIDSNHFNSEAGQLVLQQQQQPQSPIVNIPIGGGSSYKTQKFSKIQMQTIIDNLCQYDANGNPVGPSSVNTSTASRKGVMTLNAQYDNGKKQTPLKPTMQSQHMHLPDVGRSEAIAKQYNNVAGLALNAIASAKVKNQAMLGSAKPVEKPMSPQQRQVGSTVRRITSSESKNNKDVQNNSQQGHFTNYRNIIQTAAASSETVPTLSPHQKKQVQTIISPTRGVDNNATNSNIINFNNCNVTIINNNYEGAPSSSTIIQAKKVTPGGSAQASNYLTKINEISGMTPKGSDQN